MATRTTKSKTTSRTGSKARATAKRTATRKPAAKRATKPKAKSKATTTSKATRKPAASTRATTRTTAKRGKSARSATGTSRTTKRTAPRSQEGLSESTLRAKWINASEEHGDHAGQTLATRSHDVIQHWVEERGAKPATAAGTEHEGRPGVLRFDFPGYGGQDLQTVSWDDWFRTFDERNLVFVFQEHKTDGAQSNFFRLDSPQREEA